MKEFQIQTKIKAPAEKVYAALTEQAGLAKWWTGDCDIAKQKHGRSTFRFGETYTVMEIEELIPNREVRWKCVEHHHIAPGVGKKDEWVGTKLIFQLAEDAQGETELTFTHEGLRGLECESHCDERWHHYIKTSLKNLIETGCGQPFESQGYCHKYDDQMGESEVIARNLA